MALVTDAIHLKIISVGQTCGRIEVNGSQGMAQFKDEWCAVFTAGMDVKVSNFDLTWKDGVFHFKANKENTKIYICPSDSRGTLHACEVFAGLGGWTQAASAMGVEPILMVDNEENVAWEMQSMFATMQANLEKTVQQGLGADAEKRPRREEGRNDPFSTKSC